MRSLVILMLFLLVGCAGRPTTGELYTQALASGDWSAVESRERSIERRARNRGPSCPTGQVNLCTSRFIGDNSCECVSTRHIYSALARF